MHPILRFFPFIIIMLSGCNSSDDDTTPKVTVSDLSAGVYQVSSGNPDAPNIGQYYAGSDGSRLLVLNDAANKATQAYRKASSGDWSAVPAVTQDLNVSLLRHDAVANTPLTVASAAGSYVTQVSEGVIATFSIAADGSLSASNSACKLSGKLTPSSLPNALSLSLNTTACGNLPASSQGNLVLDNGYYPAAFRFITDNGTQLLDLWVYAD